MSWDTAQMNTNLALLSSGVLGPFLRGDFDVYRCPADRYLSPAQVSRSWPLRTRSISMNSVLGRFSATSDITAKGLNWALPQYVQYLKLIQIPRPARTWLVLDEHPDSIDDGYYLNSPTLNYWQDIPASYHNGGCGFAFADGHGEMRKWSSSTSRYAVRYSYPTTRVFDPPGKADFAWYLERSGYIDAKSGKPAFGY